MNPSHRDIVLNGTIVRLDFCALPDSSNIDVKFLADAGGHHQQCVDSISYPLEFEAAPLRRFPLEENADIRKQNPGQAGIITVVQLLGNAVVSPCRILSRRLRNRMLHAPADKIAGCVIDCPGLINPASGRVICPPAFGTKIPGARKIDEGSELVGQVIRFAKRAPMSRPVPSVFPELEDQVEKLSLQASLLRACRSFSIQQAFREIMGHPPAERVGRFQLQRINQLPAKGAQIREGYGGIRLLHAGGRFGCRAC